MQSDSSASAEGAIGTDDPFPEADHSRRLEFLYRDQHVALVRMLSRKVHDIEVAREIAQEAYAEIYAREKKGQRITMLRHYLFRTARNIAFDRLRKQAVRTRDTHLASHPAVVAAPSAEQVCIQQQESLYLQEAIRRLPPRCKQAFQLVQLEGLSVAAAAKEMNALPNTVSQLCSRAYAHLARALAELDQTRKGPP